MEKYFRSGPSDALVTGMRETHRGNSFNAAGNYRIEISGWGVDNSFFVERTDLIWTASGEKQVQLHRALAERSMVFVRLLAPEPDHGSVPVAYQVQGIVPMSSHGSCTVRLVQLRPRSREYPQESLTGKNASKPLEGSQRVCDTREAETRLLH